MKRCVFLFVAAVLFSGCKNTADDVLLEIKSPKGNWVYFAGTEIAFSCNVRNDNLVWNSSLDGEIGKESRFVRKLSPGGHLISLTDESSGKSVSVKIEVKESSFDSAVKQITALPFAVELPERTECTECLSAGIFSLDGSIKTANFELSPQLGADIEKRRSNRRTNFDSGQKFFRLDNDISSFENCIIKSERSLSGTEIKRNFFVINTTEPYGEPNVVTAEMYYDSSLISVWIPENYSDTYLIDEIVNALDGFVLNRVNQLWGGSADIDSNGKITLLFSPTINEENKAVGFFNSKDFFKKNTDKNDASYNPYSNEMDVIYAAVPEKSGNKNYSVESVIATISHEYAHAINFSNKTWKRCSGGEKNARLEDLFLDEGWSHLTELLCGYGISGGDMDFINYYLENSIYYSLCKNDFLGRNDSVGQRGAVCLFLYWLFEKAGGMDYDNCSGGFIDEGGISFLKSMVDSENYGWNCIGEYFGKNTDLLFIEFSKELLARNETDIFIEGKTDPITKERFSCIGLKAFSESFSGIEKYSVLPYSIASISGSGKSGCLTISGEKLQGNVYFWLGKQ